MPDFFAHRFAHTNFAGPIHTLVQIGAHGMQDVEDALRVDPAQIVLTTTDPDLARQADDALKAWRTGDKTAHVEHVAVLAKQGTPAVAKLKRFQQPALSSRKRPTGLQALFPDLAPREQLDVPTVAVAAFCRALPAMPDPARHMLRLGLTGEEHTLLSAMGDALLGRFHDIVVSLPVDAPFDRSASGAALLERLHDLGFLPLAQREGPLRGIPECHLIKSPHHAVLQDQRATDAKRQRKETKQKALIQSLTREKETLQRALDQGTLDTRDLAELRARHAALMADYDTQSDALRQVQARIRAALARLKP